MKRLNTLLIEEWLRKYYYWVLLPLATSLLLIGCYGYLINPGMFMVQLDNCHGLLVCDPVINRVELFGVPITSDFVVRTLPADEFAIVQARYSSINSSLTWVFLLLLFAFGNKYKKKLMEELKK